MMEDDLNYLALLADANPCAAELVAIVVAVELTDLIEMAVIVAAVAVVVVAAADVVAAAADS